MQFEFDLMKSKANKAKHKIDFEEAKPLWDDPLGVIIPARSETEPRYVLIAQLNSKIWCAFFTVPGERFRIISVRRARENEENEYWQP